jgi:hypothetical protein
MIKKAGGDYMPRMIDTYMSDSEHNMLLTVEREGTVNGIGACALFFANHDRNWRVT